MVMLVELTFWLFATSTQLVLKPVDRLFVCICKYHPRWSEGHDNIKVLPEMLNVIFVGLVATAELLLANEIVPFTFKLLVIQY